MKTLGVLTVLAVLGALESSLALSLGNGACLGAAGDVDPSSGCVNVENSSSQNSENHSWDSEQDETSEYTPTENGGSDTQKSYNREETVDSQKATSQTDKRNLCVSKYQGLTLDQKKTKTAEEKTKPDEKYHEEGSTNKRPVHHHEHHTFHSSLHSEDINGAQSSSGSATIEDGSNIRSYKFDSGDPSSADDERAVNELRRSYGRDGGFGGIFGRRKRDTRNTQYSSGNYNQEYKNSGSQQYEANGNYRSGGENYQVQSQNSDQRTSQYNNGHYQSAQGNAQMSQSSGNFELGSSRQSNYQQGKYRQGSAQVTSQAYAQAGQTNQGGQSSYQNYGGNQRFQQSGSGSYQISQSNGRVEQRYGSNQSSQIYNGGQQSQAYAQASSGNGQASQLGRYQNSQLGRYQNSQSGKYQNGGNQRNFVSRRGSYQTQGGFGSGRNFQTRQLNNNSQRNSAGGQGYRYGQGNNRFANRRTYTQKGKQSGQINRSGNGYSQSGNQNYQNRGNQSGRRYQSAILNRVGSTQGRNGYQQINRRYNQNANHKDILGYLKQHGYHRSGYTDFNRYGTSKHYGFNKGQPVNKNPHATEYRHADVREYLKGYGTYNPAVANNHGNVQYVRKNTGIIDNTPFFTGNGRYVLIPGQNGDSHRYYDTVSKNYLTVKFIKITDSGKRIIVPGSYAGNAGKGEANPGSPGYNGQGYNCGYDVYYLGNGTYKYKDQIIPADKIVEFTKSKGLNIPFTDKGLPLGRFHSIFGGNFPVNLGSGLFYLNNGSYKYKDQAIPVNKIADFLKNAGISNIPITKNGYPEELIRGASPIDIGFGVEFLGHNLYRYKDQIVPSSQIVAFTKKLGFTIKFTSNGLPLVLVDGTLSNTTSNTTSTTTASPSPNNSGSKTTTESPSGPKKPVSSTTTASPVSPNNTGLSPDNSGSNLEGYDCGNGVYYIGNDTYKYKDQTIPVDKIATFIKKEALNISVTDKGLPLGPFYGIFGGDNFPVDLGSGVFYLGDGNYKFDDQTISADKITAFLKNKGITNISITKDGYPDELWSGDAPIDLDGGLQFLSHNHYRYDDKIIPSTKIADVIKTLNIDIPLTSNGLPLELVNETISHVLNTEAAIPTAPANSGLDQGYDCGNGIYYFSNGTYRYNGETYTQDKIADLLKSKGFKVPVTDNGLPLGPFYGVFGGNDYPIDLGSGLSYIGNGNYKFDDETISADKITIFVKDKGISNIKLTKEGYPEDLWSGEAPIDLGDGLSFLGHDLYGYKDQIIPSSKIVEFSKKLDSTIPFTSGGLPVDLINETLIHAINPDASVPIAAGNTGSNGLGYDCGQGIYYIGHGIYKYNDQIISGNDIGDFIKSKGFTFPVTDNGLPLQPFYDIFGNFPVDLGSGLYYLDDGNYKFDDDIISADEISAFLKTKNISNITLTKNGYPEDLYSGTSSVDLGGGLQFLGYSLYKYDDQIIPSSQIVQFCKKLGLTIPFTTNGLPLDLVDESLENVLGTLGSGDDNTLPIGDDDFPIDLGQGIFFNGKDEYKYHNHVVHASKMSGLIKILGLNLTLPTDLKAPLSETSKNNDSDTEGSKHIYCGYNIYYLGGGKYSYEDHIIPASYMPGLLKILGVHMKLPSDGDVKTGGADDEDNIDCEENTKKGDAAGDKSKHMKITISFKTSKDGIRRPTVRISNTSANKNVADGTRRCENVKGKSSTGKNTDKLSDTDSSILSDSYGKSKPKNKPSDDDRADESKPKEMKRSHDDSEKETKIKKKLTDEDWADESKPKEKKRSHDDSEKETKLKKKLTDDDWADESKGKEKKRSHDDSEKETKLKKKLSDDHWADESKPKEKKRSHDDSEKETKLKKKLTDDDWVDESKPKEKKRSHDDSEKETKLKKKLTDDDWVDESKPKEKKRSHDDSEKETKLKKKLTDDDWADESKPKEKKRSHDDSEKETKLKKKLTDDDWADESKPKEKKRSHDDSEKETKLKKKLTDDDWADESKGKEKKRSHDDSEKETKLKKKLTDDDWADESKPKEKKRSHDDSEKETKLKKKLTDDDWADESKPKEKKRSHDDSEKETKLKKKLTDDDWADESKSKEKKRSHDDLEKKTKLKKKLTDDDWADESKPKEKKRSHDDSKKETKLKKKLTDDDWADESKPKEKKRSHDDSEKETKIKKKLTDDDWVDESKPKEKKRSHDDSEKETKLKKKLTDDDWADESKGKEKKRSHDNSEKETKLKKKLSDDHWADESKGKEKKRSHDDSEKEIKLKKKLTDDDWADESKGKEKKRSHDDSEKEIKLKKKLTDDDWADESKGKEKKRSHDDSDKHEPKKKPSDDRSKQKGKKRSDKSGSKKSTTDSDNCSEESSNSENSCSSLLTTSNGKFKAKKSSSDYSSDSSDSSRDAQSNDFKDTSGSSNDTSKYDLYQITKKITSSNNSSGSSSDDSSLIESNDSSYYSSSSKNTDSSSSDSNSSDSSYNSSYSQESSHSNEYSLSNSTDGNSSSQWSSISDSIPLLSSDSSYSASEDHQEESSSQQEGSSSSSASHQEESSYSFNESSDN